MAIAEVASQRGSSSSPGTGTCDVAFPLSVTNGNFGIVGGGIWNTSKPSVITTSKASGTATIGSVVTLMGTTGVSYAGGFGIPFLSYFPISGSGSLTMNVQTDLSSDYINIGCDEFSGVNATPLDVDGGEATGNTDTNFTDVITTVTANDLVIGVLVGSASFATLTAGSGYTMISKDDSGIVQSYGLEFRIVAAAGPWTVNFSSSNPGSQDYSIYNAAFKEIAAAVVDLTGAFLMS